jgi:ribosome-associated protein
VVFNTEALSPLFERVIIASGTSNRQTRALANSVRETVKKRGLDVLRTEGEDNAEWIIVDCGAAVAHIMQPAIRDYYHLEEIWGAKPVRLKGAADGRGASATTGRQAQRRAAAAAAVNKPAAAKRPLVARSPAAHGPAAGMSTARSAAAKGQAAKKSAAPRPAARSPVAKRSSAKTAAGKSPSAKKPAVRKGRPRSR